MTTDHDDLVALYRDALSAIADAVNIPIADLATEDTVARDVLLDQRGVAVWSAAHSLRYQHDGDQIRAEIERLRNRIAELPVTYRRYISRAEDHSGDCVICGPGCCAPVLGVHTSCPGPLVGRTVESVR